MNFIVRFYNLKKLYLFIGIILANLLLIWVSKNLLINEVVFYNTYSEQLTYDRSLKLFESMKSISWISYAFTPIVLLLKFSLISLVIYTGLIICNIQEKISLGSVFKVVIASEAIFIIAGILKFLWFYFFAGNYDLTDLGFFSPLSLINFFKKSEVARIWIFPLQTVNLFHLIYIISISYGLTKVSAIKKADSEKVVLLSYLPGLALWIVLIMFLTFDTSL
jgi:hypothetical protein